MIKIFSKVSTNSRPLDTRPILLVPACGQQGRSMQQLPKLYVMRLTPCETFTENSQIFSSNQGPTPDPFPTLANCRAEIPNIRGERRVSHLLVYDDPSLLNIQRFCMMEPQKKDPEEFNPIKELCATIVMLHDYEPKELSQ